MSNISKWWPARCPECGWAGPSCNCSGGESLADTGDYGDVLCPRCGASVDEDNDQEEEEIALTTERDQLRARVAELESGGCTRDQRTSQYCAEAEAARAECERLRGRVAELERVLSEERAIATVDRAGRDAFMTDNARLRERGRELLIHIMRSHKASIGSIESHYTPQLSVTKVHEIAEAFGIRP